MGRNINLYNLKSPAETGDYLLIWNNESGIVNKCFVSDIVYLVPTGSTIFDNIYVNQTGHIRYIKGGNYETQTILGGTLSSILGGTDLGVFADKSTIVNGSDSDIVAGANYSFIGNGDNNQVYGTYSFVGNGTQHVVRTATTAAFLGAGTENVVSGSHSSVVNGGSNTIYGDYDFIGGGLSNQIIYGSDYSAILNGNTCLTSGDYSAVLFGNANQSRGLYALTAGRRAIVMRNGAVVFADSTNADKRDNGQDSITLAFSGGAYVSGGNFTATQSGFIKNVVGGNYGTHILAGDKGGILAGVNNRVSGENAFVCGGSGNWVNSGSLDGGIVAGSGNRINAPRAIILGGVNNEITDAGVNSAIGGGKENYIDAREAYIGGGDRNQVWNTSAVVAGGISNIASGITSCVGGGVVNTARGLRSVIAGGQQNTASGVSSCVGGGTLNQAFGVASTIPGGSQNFAQGFYSFAAGRLSKANNDGSFVLSDARNSDKVDNGPNTITFAFESGTYISGGPIIPVAGSRITVSGTAPTQSQGGFYGHSAEITIKGDVVYLTSGSNGWGEMRLNPIGSSVRDSALSAQTSPTQIIGAGTDFALPAAASFEKVVFGTTQAQFTCTVAGDYIIEGIVTSYAPHGAQYIDGWLAKLVKNEVTDLTKPFAGFWIESEEDVSIPLKTTKVTLAVNDVVDIYAKQFSTNGLTADGDIRSTATSLLVYGPF